ncbi:MAG TPA: T9SS type A sorting domain-containing protein, partial [Ferruginibacter sp.]|nr:T9SS type A sorting domain-containing protein [Ferruginibacter sp.]
LYGTLYYNGPLSYGTLFEIDPASNTFTKLVDFNYTTMGGNPIGKLVANGSKFLGMCYSGGVNGTGTIYEWDPASPNTVVKKYDFGVNNTDNPIKPGSTLISFGSKFYATTYNGGFNDQGTLFEYNNATATVTKKLNFNTAENGRIPYGRPTLLNGKMYGTCYTAPQPDAGCIWEYDPSTTVYSRKFNFDMATGSGSGNRPNSAPVAYNGKLYGTLPNGGTSGYGVFYEYDPVGNIYTKSDMQPIGGAYPIGEPTFYSGKFYGMTNANGAGNYGIIYSYDPATTTLVKLLDVQSSGSIIPGGGFTVYNNKLYGTTTYGGTGNLGGIIMYDPVANTASTVYSFPTGGATGFNVQNQMTVYNNKLYGNTINGGSFSQGVIFEFDPATNNYTSVHNYSTVSGQGGYNPSGLLTVSGNKMHTITHYFNDVIIAQFDPATNTLTQRSIYTPANSYNVPGYHNALTVFPAFIANGIPNSCETYPTVVINGANNNIWVPILNNDGDVVAEIKANGNNLGNVNASAYINSGAVREDGRHQLYLDRNITINVQNPPAGNVDLRLYIKTSEYLALKNAVNSMSQPSGITSINDIAIFKNQQVCPSEITENAYRLTTTNENYEYGYILKTSVSSFSTFSFAKNTFSVLPVNLLSFNAIKQNNSVKLNWVTENEINFSNYEIEKSTDGIKFDKIAIVAAIGNVLQNNYYKVDDNPNMGLNYYRLKMISKNGDYTYSKIIMIDFSKKTIITIQPNPANDYIVITGADEFKYIQIFDASGKVVKQFDKKPDMRYSLKGLNKGVYFIRLTANNNVVTSKIIIE